MPIKQEVTGKNVIFLCAGSMGHINPILAIAAELQMRNHNVTILTLRPLGAAASLEAKGFKLDYCVKDEVAEIKGSLRGEENVREMVKPKLEMFRRGPVDCMTGTYGAGGLAVKYLEEVIEKHEDIREKLNSMKPDLLIHDYVVPVLCATKIPKKWVRFYSGYPSALFSAVNDHYVGSFGLKLEEMDAKWKQTEAEIKAPVIELVAKFCEAEKIPHWPNKIDLCPSSPHLNFYMGPNDIGLESLPGMNMLPGNWFKLEHTIDSPESSQSTEFQTPECLRDVSGKLIYFSLGTLASCDVELTNLLLKMLSRSPNKFIVSMGQFHKSIKLYPNMWGGEYLDQKAILSKADLFITHAGHNSIIETFYHGVPVITLPIFADQFDLAQMVNHFGFGIRLNPYHCTQEELLGSIESLLANRTLKERMGTISSRLKSIKYHELAADKLEQLLMV